jgi:hypothetical protein
MSWVASSVSKAGGYDYVAHDNVLPYSPVSPPGDGSPVANSMFDFFFTSVRFRQLNTSDSALGVPQGVFPIAKPSLAEWQRKNLPTLNRVAVYRSVTSGISVTVMPFYDGVHVPSVSAIHGGAGPNSQLGVLRPHGWQYKVHLENTGVNPVQILGRVWIIHESTTVSALINKPRPPF